MKRLGLFSMLGAVFVVAGCSEGVMEPVVTFAPQGPSFGHISTDPDIEAADWDIDVDGTTVDISWQWINMNNNSVITPDGDASWVEFQACTSAVAADCSGTEHTSEDLGGIETSYHRTDTPPGFYRIRIGHKHGRPDSEPRWSPYSEVFEVVSDAVLWDFTGFYRPVSQESGVMTRIRRGSTVPLRFNVFEDEQEITDVGELGAQFEMTPIPCNGDAVESEDAFETTGGTSLRYDVETGQFVQNWQAPRRTGCYEVTLSTVGGSLSATFNVF